MGGGLGVSCFLECCAEGGVFLAVDEETSDFGFGCRGDDVLHYVFNGVNGTVWCRRGGWRLSGVLRSVTKLVVAANAPANFVSSEVRGITGDVEYHAAGVVADDGVWVGGAVVEELSERLVRVSGACHMRRGEVAEGDAHGRVAFTGIPDQRSHHLLVLTVLGVGEGF